MNDKERSGVIIKSNVTLKSRGVEPSMDNIQDQYFDVRLNSALTLEQRLLKNKILLRAGRVLDENGDEVLDECYKGCLNCGEENNHCKRPQNRSKQNTPHH